MRRIGTAEEVLENTVLFPQIPERYANRVFIFERRKKKRVEQGHVTCTEKTTFRNKRKILAKVKNVRKNLRGPGTLCVSRIRRDRAPLYGNSIFFTIVVAFSGKREIYFFLF